MRTVGRRDRIWQDPSCPEGSEGVPLSRRRTCPDLAPCRLDVGRLSWLQRAGPSATLDKSLFGCPRDGAAGGRDEQGPRARRGQAGARDPQPLEVGRPPALGDVDRVERVQVQVDDAVGRIGDERRQALEQAVRPVEAAGPDQPGDEPGVLDQEPVRVGDPDPGADREQPLRLGDARQAEMDGQRRCPRPGGRPATSRSRPGRSRAGSSCSWRTAALARSASSSGASAMKAWPCG